MKTPGPGPSSHDGPRSDDGPGPGLLTWDWRGQPDLDDLRQLLLGFGVHLTEVDTGSDEYAIVLSAVPLSDAEAVDVFARRWEE